MNATLANDIGPPPSHKDLPWWIYYPVVTLLYVINLAVSLLKLDVTLIF